MLRASKLSIFNTSKMDLGKMDQHDIKANLESYVQAFSPDAREIFEHFKFSEFVGLQEDANLLFKVVKKFAMTDLSPKAIPNHEMGLVFEEFIRRFAESSNETAGEHFTPRDIVRLTTSLVFMEDDKALTQDGELRDNENVPLNPSVSTSKLTENYFKAEVLPLVADSWINAEKKDNNVGIVGYEINFHSYFQRKHYRDKLLKENRFI